MYLSSAIFFYKILSGDYCNELSVLICLRWLKIVTVMRFCYFFGKHMAKSLLAAETDFSNSHNLYLITDETVLPTYCLPSLINMNLLEEIKHELEPQTKRSAWPSIAFWPQVVSSVLCSQLLTLYHTDCISALSLGNIQFPNDYDAHNEINYGFFQHSFQMDLGFS